MDVFIERENKHLELEAKDGIELLSKLNIVVSTVLIVRNGKIVLAEEVLSNDDKIQILSVVSGG